MPMLMGYYACVDNDLDFQDVELITLSKHEEYMKEYIQFCDQEEIVDPKIIKYFIAKGDYTIFNPFKNLHRYILCTSLPYKFEINSTEYTKKQFINDISEEDNAYIMEDPYIVEQIRLLGFIGFISNDRGYPLYNIFNPDNYLVFQSSRTYDGKNGD
jgi:hypothetical protein